MEEGETGVCEGKRAGGGGKCVFACVGEGINMQAGGRGGGGAQARHPPSSTLHAWQADGARKQMSVIVRE